MSCSPSLGALPHFSLQAQGSVLGSPQEDVYLLRGLWDPSPARGQTMVLFFNFLKNFIYFLGGASFLKKDFFFFFFDMDHFWASWMAQR